MQFRCGVASSSHSIFSKVLSQTFRSHYSEDICRQVAYSSPAVQRLVQGFNIYSLELIPKLEYLTASTYIVDTTPPPPPTLQLADNLFQPTMSVHLFVAHFLKKEGYVETLKAFENEHGRTISTDLPQGEDLGEIIADRLKYLTIDEKPQSLHEVLLDESLKLLKRDQFKEWSAPYPRNAVELSSIDELVVACALFERGGDEYAIFATAKLELVVVDLKSRKRVFRGSRIIGLVVIRKIQVVGPLLLLCGMNGKLYICTFGDGLLELQIIREKQLHDRLVSDLKVVRWKEKNYLVSLGWDFLVKVHEITDNSIQEVFLPYKLSTRGICMDACVYNDQLVILVGKSEITLMDVLTVKNNAVTLSYRIALNDAEFTAAGFSPHAIQIYSGGKVPLVAVGTSHEPFMRLVVVSLKGFGDEGESIRRNQIVTNINSLSPQDKYSLALLSWRPDGSGVWVYGEDGVIRGIDLLKEDVVVTLNKSQDRIKSFAVSGDLLLVCGTDKRVFLWTR